MFIIFGGFFVTPPNIPVWLRWFSYLSPYSWSVRALANNEFLSPRYSAISDTGETLGVMYLRAVDMHVGQEWIGYGVLFLLGFTLFCIVGNSVLLQRQTAYEAHRGTARAVTRAAHGHAQAGKPAFVFVSDLSPYVTSTLTASANSDAHAKASSGVGGNAKAQASSGVDVSADASADVAAGHDETCGDKDGNASRRLDDNSDILKTLREVIPFTPQWLTFTDLYYTVPVTTTQPKPQLESQQQQQSQSPQVQPQSKPQSSSQSNSQPPQASTQSSSIAIPINERVSAQSALLNQDLGGVDSKVLLCGVSGYAEPGTLTALMGASGAGKTTLLDVLAGRKTVGTVAGEIKLNGRLLTLYGNSNDNRDNTNMNMNVTNASSISIANKNDAAADNSSTSMTSSSSSHVAAHANMTASKSDLAVVTGYVEQNETLLATDSVRETLLFAAKLRLLPSMQSSSSNNSSSHLSTPLDDVIDRVVDEVLDVLELTAIQHKLVGSPATTGTSGSLAIQGLSPSQLKRVNIGLELVTNPAILFLDEPTTGLDSRAAQTVMRVVRRIARSGRSVICTIHQPSAELFYLFDRLVLLAPGGKQVYFGNLGQRSKGLVGYLERVPGVEKVRPRHNPATWMLEQLQRRFASGNGSDNAVSSATALSTMLNEEEGGRSHLSSSSLTSLNGPASTEPTVLQTTSSSLSPPYSDRNSDNSLSDRLVSAFEYSELRTNTLARITDMNSKLLLAHQQSINTSSNTTHLVSSASGMLWFKFALVLRRTWLSYWRNPGMLLARFGGLLFLSLLFGCVYFDLSLTTQSSVTSLIGAVSVVGIYGAVTHSNNALPAKLTDRAVFYRELSSELYPPVYWALASLLCDLVWVTAGALILQIPQYFMIGLHNSAEAFFKFFLALYMFCIVFVSVSAAVSSLSKNPGVAVMFQGLFYSLAFNFAGVSVPYPKMPRGYVWLFRMLPISHLTEALAMPQFASCFPLPDCSPLVLTVTDTGASAQPVLLPAATVASEYLGFGFHGYWHAIGWITLFLAFLWFVALYFTARVRFDKR